MKWIEIGGRKMFKNPWGWLQRSNWLLEYCYHLIMVNFDCYYPIQPRIARYGARYLIPPDSGRSVCRLASRSIRTIQSCKPIEKSILFLIHGDWLKLILVRVHIFQDHLKFACWSSIDEQNSYKFCNIVFDVICIVHHSIVIWIKHHDISSELC